jgi:hypothetical protein
VHFNFGKIAILLLLAAPAQAQLWSGPAAVEVRVQDPKGAPIAGAQVRLQYTALDPKDGPPAVETDARGQVNVGGLAEGTWIVEVSRDGFMTYVAQINVREGDRPTVLMATQVKVPGAQRTMAVALARGRKAPPPPKPAVVAEMPAPALRPSLAPRAEPAPSAPPIVSTPRTEIPPTPVPEPQPAPPEPRREEPVQTIRPEPPAAPAPVPTPTPEPPARTAPVQSAPPAPVPPADPVRLRTARDRTCFECPPGESALSTERVVPPGGGSGCGEIAAQLKSGAVPAGLPGGCHVLRIALPAGARYTGYRFEVQDRGDSLDCLAGQACPQGTGRWPINPVLIRNPEGTVVLAPFESGPAERERRAVLTVYFTTGVAKRPR